MRRKDLRLTPQKYQLLNEIIMKYTRGESSSVTIETAEKLLIAIWYTIDAYLFSFDNISFVWLKCLQPNQPP